MDPHDDTTLQHILSRTRVVAVVGLSPNPARPSYQVAQYLTRHGFQVIPVNPGHAGKELFGEPVRASLSDCPPSVDMIDIFRASDHVLPIVEQALAALPALRTVWMQIGVSHPQAAALALSRGVDVVQDRCTKLEHQRLLGSGVPGF
ncbi:CoA-binding protein [Roseicitreum antarcticum]|uniref:CoA-binding domain-containing protein n=1 Tax=Roseicitreum antarcticum TaxID=564137 RepID=A0A1H2TGQ1_9RHOB|nr:CoA-binding protein [Roseicitreum antarcticum]SDW42399.1 hypothetical protein SAMN04488238_10233 [Roseicitreum antarcticum]